MVRQADAAQAPAHVIVTIATPPVFRERSRPERVGSSHQSGCYAGRISACAWLRCIILIRINGRALCASARELYEMRNEQVPSRLIK